MANSLAELVHEKPVDILGEAGFCVPEPGEIKPIHPQFHLEILTFPSERALRVFIEHGVQVDVDSQVVCLSPELVTTALAHAPRSYVLSGRAEGTDLTLDGANSYFGTDGCGTETVDFGIDVSILTNEGGGV
jgi:hypothetical protein